MLHVLGKLPREVVVAVSGGPDSMAILDFLSNNHKVTAYYFDHGTYFGEQSYNFLRDYCANKKIPFVTSVLSADRPKGKSLEEHWRDERYERFHDYNLPIVTGHNLDDVIEWFLFSSLHGKGKIIPYNNKNVIRPFLTTPKKSLLDWCQRKKVPFLTDPGNDDKKFMRSIIRHDMMPHAQVINPGIQKTFKKLVEKEYTITKGD